MCIADGLTFAAARTGRTMNRIAGNGLTLSELEQIEESAQHSETSEAKTVLRLSAALREALQAKENAFALAAEFKKKAEAAQGESGKAFEFRRVP